MVSSYWYSLSKWSFSIALAWNWFGIILLINVFLHGLLSTPTPFQQIITNPSNRFVGYFPYICLPVFVFPWALFFIFYRFVVLN